MKRLLKWTAVFLFIFILAGCNQARKWYYCGYGQKSAQNKEYEVAINLLDSCLESASLSPGQRALYLQTRAWAHFNLDAFENALRDQERSFELVPPGSHREYINHASYLRMSGRPLESLEPLRKAEILDRRAGHASMMTQYNLGWSLYQLGRYEEAISAFSRGITQQPDYPFVYFRRGLAYDRIGRIDQAESDFIEFVSFFENEEFRFKQRFTNELSEASVKYTELKILLAEKD